MGLLRAGIGAAAGVLADQWRDYVYCDALPNDTLVVKGRKRTGGNDNILSDGSVIAVNEGQCMIAVVQGRVVEICAEAGEFVFEGGSEPSIFYGDLGDKVMESFRRIGHRFSFGGDTANDVRVYFVNTKEIMGNKYGTPTPVPFRVVDANIGLDTDISVRCNGEYSYQIVDPIAFYTNVCANVTDTFRRDAIDSQLKSEFLTALQPGFGRLSEMGIRYSSVPAHTLELAQALQEVLSASWTDKRGIAIVGVGVNGIVASPEDEERIKELQRMAVMRDPNMRAANLSMAQGDAMRTAAGNEAGAMMGFMGMNMANAAAMGAGAQGIYESAAQPYQQRNAYAVAGRDATTQANAGATGADTWTCGCGHTNTGKFCAECGAPRPAPASTWTCPSCGHASTGKFCAECGTPRPPTDGWNCACGHHNAGTAKFCAECGQPRA